MQFAMNQSYPFYSVQSALFLIFGASKTLYFHPFPDTDTSVKPSGDDFVLAAAREHVHGTQAEEEGSSC